MLVNLIFRSLKYTDNSCFHKIVTHGLGCFINYYNIKHTVHSTKQSRTTKTQGGENLPIFQKFLVQKISIMNAISESRKKITMADSSRMEARIRSRSICPALELLLLTEDSFCSTWRTFYLFLYQEKSLTSEFKYSPDNPLKQLVQNDEASVQYERF